jgi:hypothetical protein
MIMGLMYLSLIRKEGPNTLRQLIAASRGQSLAPSELNYPGTRGDFDRLMNANGAVFIQQLLQVADDFAHPYPQARSSLRTTASMIASKKKMDLDYAVIATLSFDYEHFLNQIQSSEARAAVIRAGAAALAWKARHGAFPARLNEVLHPVPTDPFNGKPLRYRREGNGFAVFSIGPSGTFSGGTPDNKPGNLETVFRYPLPAYYRGK